MRTHPTVESLARAKPRRIPVPKGHPILKEALERERNLLRQMSHSGWNMYNIAEEIKKRPPVALARPSGSGAPPQQSRPSSSDSRGRSTPRDALPKVLVIAPKRTGSAQGGREMQRK